MPAQRVLALVAAAAISIPALADVVISQIYTGGGEYHATYAHDYVELFNRSAQPVDITLWTLQYSAAASTTWRRTFLTGVVQPGGYYLIALGGPGHGGADLPVADIGDQVNFAVSGKLALLAGYDLLSGACPADPRLMDLVGYGAPNCSETSPAPATTEISALLRNDAGCADTDNNNADFVVVTPIPRNSSFPFQPCIAGRGACCALYECTIQTAAGCAALAGTYLGDGAGCGGGACPPRPCSTILEARNMPEDEIVRVCNAVVSSVVDFSTDDRTFQIQDGTAGITVLGTDAEISDILAQSGLGHSIVLEGRRRNAYGASATLVAPLRLIADNGFVGVPAPQRITSAEVGEPHDSELVSIACAEFNRDSGTFMLGQGYSVVDAIGQFELLIWTGELANQPIPAGPRTIVGIVQHTSQYYPPHYSLVARTPDDFQQLPGCPTRGACCRPDQTCVYATVGDCAQAGGVYFGDLVQCSEFLCGPCAGQRRGDTNCDGRIDNFDIQCFVLALTNPSQWQSLCSNNGACTMLCTCDTNRDGVGPNNFDIDPFVECLIHSGCPEP